MDDRVHVIARMLRLHEEQRDQQRALLEREEETMRRIVCVEEYRDGLIAKRDRKASQIPLRASEERMWEYKIGLAEGTITTLRAELSALREGPLARERETE